MTGNGTSRLMTRQIRQLMFDLRHSHNREEADAIIKEFQHTVQGKQWDPYRTMLAGMHVTVDRWKDKTFFV